MSLELSLYTIEDDLLSLIQMREEIAGSGIADNTTPTGLELLDQLKTIDQQIAEYVRAEIRKVDNIGGLWRHFASMAALAKCEAKRLDAVAKNWEARLERLKYVCQVAMESFEWRAGKPRMLEGKSTKLYLKANGGRCAVEISNPELVPSEYQRVTMECSGDVWAELTAKMGTQWIKENVGRTTVTPALSLIGEALEKDAVAGCRLLPRSSHVEMR